VPTILLLIFESLLGAWIVKREGSPPGGRSSPRRRAAGRRRASWRTPSSSSRRHAAADAGLPHRRVGFLFVIPSRGAGARPVTGGWARRRPAVVASGVARGSAGRGFPPAAGLPRAGVSRARSWTDAEGA
jgi:hypothetical protein